MKRSVVRYLSFVALLGATFIARNVQAAVWDLTNSAFELIEPDGSPTGWRAAPSVYKTEENSGRNGSSALRWSSDDASVYELAAQSFPFEPGACIEASVWIKTENVQGRGATICVEWGTKDRFIGGVYAAEINGTNDWIKVSLRATIPAEAEEAHITCYGARGSTGTAWFDEVSIKPWLPPFFSGIATDHYRHITDGEPLRFVVGVDSNRLDGDLSKIDAPLVITGDALSVPISVAPESYGKDAIYFNVDTKDLAPGKYTATLTAKDPFDNKEVAISRTFTRVEAYPEYKTTIDLRRRAIVDGKPFFPLGLYFSGVDKDSFEIFADSAFNCIMPYSSISRESLDLCQEKGIKVIYSVKDNYPGLQVKTLEEGIERTKNTVEALKDHPAIFAWYINDELPISMQKELSDRRDLMEELDPSRPTWVVLYQIDDIRYYIPTTDVIGTDPYPIPNGSPARAGDHARRTNDAVFNMQADWQVPQIFNWASYHELNEKKDFRAPTYEEMRSMAWMSIAGGANGLVFYSWFDLWKMDKTVEEGGFALVREPFDERWAQVKKMAAEIADHFPILLADEDPREVAVLSKGDERKGAFKEKVMLRAYGFDGKTYALIVNMTEETQKVELSIPEDAKDVSIEMGGKILERSQGALSVELAPLEPAFVVLGF